MEAFSQKHPIKMQFLGPSVAKTFESELLSHLFCHKCNGASFTPVILLQLAAAQHSV